MKKMLSIILAIVMVCSLSVTAFADDTWNGSTENNDNEFSSNVAATYSAATSSAINVCKVVISWEVTNGSYTAGETKYTWNTTEHKYDKGETTGESTTNPSVKVSLTNHSDVALYADITYTDTNDNVVSSATDIENVELATGVTVTDNNYAAASYNQPDAVENTMEITITDWSKITASEEVIGKVTVTLSKTA